MKAGCKRWRLVGSLVVAVALAAGCNLASMTYFLTTGLAEPKEEPGELKLAVAGKETKVAVVTYTSAKGTDFARLDVDLSGMLVRKLQHYCKDNKENVTFISPSKVEEYKGNNPNWTLKPAALGEKLGADKVIFLEVEQMSLYEPGSANQLYRGRANISVKLFDLRNPDEFRLDKTYSCEYPSSRGPVSVDDMPPRQFYQTFVAHVAKHLSWYFTAHPLSETVGCD
jgi:hypothetical protein